MTCRDHNATTGVDNTRSAVPAAANGENAVRTASKRKYVKTNVKTATDNCAPKLDIPVTTYTIASTIGSTGGYKVIVNAG